MDLGGKKVLVTGAAGFIPSHIVDRLVIEGAEVAAIDNMQNGHESNLEKSRDKIQFEKADIREAEKISQLVKDQDVVFHLAANANVPYSVKHPDYDFSTNVIGTYNILKAAMDSDVRIVYASTAAVYGDPQYTPVDEKHPLEPVSPYGGSKLAAERIGFAYHRTYGIPFTAIRVFNTYGPRQRHYVLADLVRKLSNNPKKLEVLGTGEQIRDYCFISDTVDAFISAAIKKCAIGEVFNISGGCPISIKELVEHIANLLELNPEIIYTGKSWKGDITVLQADIAKISRVLEWKPKVDLKRGLCLFKQWYNE
ncbi:MAG: SDR family NAD(P)-dependent oxidoreductase [archaeon]